MKKKVGIRKRLISFLNKIIPKKNIILFNSFPDFCDNSYALYQYILKKRRDILENYRIVWAVNSVFNITGITLSANTQVIEKKSIKGIWIFLHSKYVISTHGYFMDIKSANGQKQINLWHGCGYKDLPPEERGYRGDFNIVISNIHKKLYSEFFLIEEKNVFITGYPRNDVLFNKYSSLQKLNVDKTNFKKIVLWMPTYRKATQGHNGIDGNLSSFVSSNLSKAECKELNSVLRNNEYLMVAKLHPMEYTTLGAMKGLSNIKCISSKELENSGVQLYELLTESDVLLCDYSSLVIDYLLLDQPIAMVLSDMKEYKESRGFVFYPVENYFPGPIIANLQEMIQYLNNINEIDSKWISKRLELKNLFHYYQDQNSSQRVAKLIWEEL